MCYTHSMRTIVNISMSAGLAKELSDATKEGNFSSKSEFVRDLLRSWQERKLLAEIEASRREIASGKGKVLKSLRDLR